MKDCMNNKRNKKKNKHRDPYKKGYRMKTEGQKEADKIYKTLRTGIKSFKKDLKVKIRTVTNG